MSDTKKTSSKPATSMAELMANQGNKFQTLQKGQLIEGTIKKLTAKEILMDIGAKGDALVIEYDKQNLENLLTLLKEGDRVSASVISPESEEGFPVVSLRRMLDDIIYGKFENFSKNDEAFEVDVAEATRGGYYAGTNEGIKGFLPNSQVVNDTGDLVGKKIKVKILEFDRAKKRVVFSQKALDYVMNPEQIGKHVKRDDIVDATVTSIAPYGLFVAIKPSDGVLIEGFVHISEVAFERVENLNSGFKSGDKIKAQVIEVDNANKRVNLSIKKTLKDSFLEVKDKFKLEDKIKGKIVETKSRGVMVDLGDGIMGMIPSDKIPSGTTYTNGDSVSVEVVQIDEKRRVVVLSPILSAIPIGYR